MIILITATHTQIYIYRAGLFCYPSQNIILLPSPPIRRDASTTDPAPIRPASYRRRQPSRASERRRQPERGSPRRRDWPLPPRSFCRRIHRRGRDPRLLSPSAAGSIDRAVIPASCLPPSPGLLLRGSYPRKVLPLRTSSPDVHHKQVLHQWCRLTRTFQ